VQAVICAKSRFQAEATVQRGHTGRCSTTNELDKLAQLWSENPSDSHEGAKRFSELLRSLPSIQNGPILGFRGRRDEKTDIKSWEDMGPPVKGVTKGGRYDASGSTVLYMCSTKEAVALEKPGNGILCIQEYVLPTDKMAILDARARQSSRPEFLDSIFDLAESCCVEGRKGRDDFKFSQLIAQLVASAGFDGFIVPGVRGKRQFWYTNIVIFKPGAAWRDWSKREAGFERQSRG
jgi:hypothetical protein